MFFVLFSLKPHIFCLFIFTFIFVTFSLSTFQLYCNVCCESITSTIVSADKSSNVSDFKGKVNIFENTTGVKIRCVSYSKIE